MLCQCQCKWRVLSATEACVFFDMYACMCAHTCIRNMWGPLKVWDQEELACLSTILSSLSTIYITWSPQAASFFSDLLSDSRTSRTCFKVL